MLKYSRVIIFLYCIAISCLSFSQGKFIINGAKVNVVNGAYLTTSDVSLTMPSLLNVDKSTLVLSNTISSDSNIVLRYGTLKMRGAASQLIPLNAFKNNALKNLVVSNTSIAGVSLNGALDIYESLTYTGSNMKVSTNDNLTFKSTAAATAWLGDMTGNSIIGKATVERYISAHKGWRFLSIPTNTTQTIQQAWQEACGANANCVTGFGTQITGAGGTAAGFDLYSALPSMKTYNSSNDTWVAVPNTNSATIKNLNGYMTFVRGDRGVVTFNGTATQTVMRTKGILYTGNQPPLTVNAGEFTSIGNPYPSALDLRYIVKPGVKNFFYVWDSQLGGTYGYGAYQTLSYNGTDYIITPGMGSYGASGSVNNFIQSGQAFFVQGDVSGGSVTFDENDKIGGSVLTSAPPPAAPHQQLRTNLFTVNSDNSTFMSDGLLINYGDNYSNNVDDEDAIKSINSSENLSIKNTNKLLVVERRHTIDKQDTIFLNLTNTKIQKYRFEITADELDAPGLTAVLEDLYLQTRTPVNLSGITLIDFNIANIPASYAANRFRIVFTPPVVLPLTITSVKAKEQENNIAVEWRTESESGIKQYEVEKSFDGTHFNIVTTVTAKNASNNKYNWLDEKAATGYNYYRIKSTGINGEIVYSKTVKVFVGNLVTSIKVYPNPVSNGIINLQFNNQPEGTYKITLVDKSGKIIFIKQITHSSQNTNELLQPDKYLPHGIYQAEITKPSGDVINLEIAVIK